MVKPGTIDDLSSVSLSDSLSKPEVAGSVTVMWILSVSLFPASLNIYYILEESV
jgi:hypothetical protein